MSSKKKDQDSLEDFDLSCMDVWGGAGSTDRQFQRPGLDVGVWSQSCSCAEAGGSELYLVSSCASGRITRMMLADVCGLGNQFSEIAGGLKMLMSRNVNSISQSRFVKAMSHQFQLASNSGVCAAALISTYFAPTGTFTLCNAGQPPPLLYRVETKAWSVLKTNHTKSTLETEASLGCVAYDEYQDFKTKLKVGDRVLICSNSLTECLDSNGRVLGLEGLLRIVDRLPSGNPSEMVSDLNDHLKTEHADNLENTDVTFMICQATETAVSWRDNIFAPFRLFGRTADKTSFD